MSAQKFSNNTWFWILQFCGWGLIGISQFTLKFTILKSVTLEYLVTECVLIVFSGVLFTSLLRMIIKGRVSIENINFKMLVILFILVFVTSLLLAAFQIMVAGYFYFQIEGKEIETSRIANVFSTFMLLFFWTILYVSIKSIVKAQKEKVERLKLESTLRESQLNTLKGQINPHFMFNSLNNIRALMLEDVPKSRKMITKLSELLRYSLNSNKIDQISLREELETVNNYVELSKIQLEKRLKYEEQVDDQLLDIEIPPMLIQMLVENAIKHGVSNQVGGGLVSVKIYKETSNFIVEVANTGKLINGSTSTKIGLRNISERLRLLYGEKSSFVLNEHDNEVVAKIKITLNE